MSARRFHNFTRPKLKEINSATRIEKQDNKIYYYGNSFFNGSFYRDRLLAIDIKTKDNFLYRIIQQNPRLDSPIERLEVYNINEELIDVYNYILNIHYNYPPSGPRTTENLNNDARKIINNILNT